MRTPLPITACRRKKQAKDLAIYQYYDHLKSQPGAMATACELAVMKKYGIKGRATVWATRKRVEDRMQTARTTQPGPSPNC